MSFSFNWYDDHKLVICSFKGDITGQDLVEAYAALCMDDRYYNNYHQLWDCRFISSLKSSKRDLKALKLMVELYCPPENEIGNRRVALLTPKYHVYAFANVVLTVTGKQSQQRKVFRTFPAAKAWLSTVLNKRPLRI